jgi:hypothetical protein
MVLLRKRRVFAAKTEATPGTAETLANADGAFNCYNLVIQPSVPVEERTAQAGFNRLSGVPGPRTGTATFRTDVHYDGTNIPSWASVLLPACGWVNDAGIFRATSEAPGSNVKTLTIGCYADGKLFSIAGAMGTFNLVLPAGQMAYIDWTFTGKWQAVTNTAMITPTYPTPAPLVYRSATTTFNSVALCVDSVTVDAGNNVIMRECTADASGFATALVTDRYPRITASPEAAAIGTRDPHAQLLAGTQATFQLSVTVGTAGAFQVNAPAAQVLNTQDEDRNGVMVDSMEWGCNKNGANLNQDLNLVFVGDA